VSTFTYTGQAEHLDELTSPTITSPFHWLLMGMSDLSKSPATSIAIGMAFTALCVLGYSAVAAAPMFSVSVIVVLLTAGTYLAAAAYHVPLLRERGVEPGTAACLRGVRKHLAGISMFALASALIVAAWTRLSSIVFALYFGNVASGSEIARIWTSGELSTAMLAFLVTASVLLAAAIFVVGAVSLPLITERNTDIVTSVRTGARALRAHLPAVISWVALIIALTIVALLSQLVLMPLLFPLLAFATWHSYRHLVQENN